MKFISEMTQFLCCGIYPMSGHQKAVSLDLTDFEYSPLRLQVSSEWADVLHFHYQPHTFFQLLIRCGLVWDFHVRLWTFFKTPIMAGYLWGKYNCAVFFVKVSGD